MIKIPEIPPKEIKSIDCGFARFEYIQKVGFTYLAWNWIRPLVKFLRGKKCLEVMAGTGSLSRILRDGGIDIISTDNMEWHKINEYKHWSTNLDKNVEELDTIEAVIKYGKQIDIVIMSWPYMDDTAYRVVKKLSEVNSNAMILYIGEDYSGATANDDFFDHFKEIDNDDISEVNKEYWKARWYGMHDYFMLGVYKENMEVA